MLISDWSSDVCSSDLPRAGTQGWPQVRPLQGPGAARSGCYGPTRHVRFRPLQGTRDRARHSLPLCRSQRGTPGLRSARACCQNAMMMTGAPIKLTQADAADVADLYNRRSEEHTSELQSLMRISYAVYCLKKKKIMTTQQQTKLKHTIHTKYLH